jgi:hypothetical protein
MRINMCCWRGKKCVGGAGGVVGVEGVALLLVALGLVLLLGARWRALSLIGAAALVGVGRWLWLRF